MYLDSYYLIFVVPALLIAFYAQTKVSTTFAKYSKVMSMRRITGREAAMRVLSQSGVSGVGIEQVAGNLTDHYDPRINVIKLSQNVYNSTSVAAIGVACHEAGHAIQHAEEYQPIKLRAAVIPITQFGSGLSMPLVLLGLVMSIQALVVAGIVLFSTVLAFQLITLPVEFDASRRAVLAISEGGILSDEELKGTKKVLTAAALTYVAALIVSIANMLRLIMLARNGSRRG